MFNVIKIPVICIAFPGTNRFEDRPLLRIPRESQPYRCGEHLPRMSFRGRRARLPHANHQPAGRSHRQAAGKIDTTTGNLLFVTAFHAFLPTG